MVFLLNPTNEAVQVYLRTEDGLLHARHLHPVLYTDCSVVDTELQFIGSCIVPFGVLIPVPSFPFPALSDLARRCSPGRPVPRVSDRTGDEAPSCPGSSVFPAVPVDGSSSCPDSRMPQLGFEANCQVAPALCFAPCRR